MAGSSADDTTPVSAEGAPCDWASVVEGESSAKTATSETAGTSTTSGRSW